ncbi:hypothetical protein HYV80_07000 [Candidatus Woesearchaeota archaeon]|nr:hypothetical protein [Candidatus Woesearchaeota archaeon]
MPFSILTIVAGAVVAYFIVMFVMHKLFEKFFMILFFVLSMLFVVGVLYFVLKGA